ncbi:FecR family protein [uncultured Algibacter sp.]|uniref:FecR family protein n=1 Tax=uncultured Algibacter sp. TaxID=298659 RepID=UPI002604BE86|nr:FecR family protein [uncultured Algibacter sp.]
MMNREELISKWLDNDLSNQELEAFKQLDDYDELIKLNHSLKAFKADEYNTSKELEGVLTTVKNKKQSSRQWLKPFMRIAAILAVCFGLYYYTTTLDTTISTEFAQKTTIELPDYSSVSLNAKSLLAFNKNKWKQDREVKLQGEAFFKVAKGSSFKVKTASGIVTVYGTQFNIKQRNNYFEVICYEGLVGVSYNSQESKLKAGDSFLILDGKLIAKEKENRIMPSWLNNVSSFKSLPYKTIITEFERQYNVEVTLIGIDSTQLFTGSFAHDNIELALKSISLPLNATYSKTNRTIILKRE